MSGLSEEIEKESAKLIADVYKDLAQSSVRQIGTAFGSVIEWALQSTYRLRLGNERRRLEFERNLKMLGENVAAIPPGQTIEVPPEMSVPLLQKLSYASNEDIARLYANLLASAANEKTANQAHPAFIGMIERMSADEAIIINAMGQGQGFDIPYMYVAAFRDQTKTEYFEYHNLRYLTRIQGLNLAFKENTEAYISNLISMGIIVDLHPADYHHKQALDQLRKGYQDYLQSSEREFRKEFPRGVYEVRYSALKVTLFGRLFIEACRTKSPTAPSGPSITVL